MKAIYDWLKNSVIPRDPNHDFKNYGNKIENTIPCVYDQYAFIYHPIFLDLDKQDQTEEETEEENLRLQITRLIEKAVDLFEYKGTYTIPNAKEDGDLLVEQIVKSKYPEYHSEMGKEDMPDALREKMKILLEFALKAVFQNFEDRIKSNLNEDDSKRNLSKITWECYAQQFGLVFHNEISWGTFIKYFNTHGIPLNFEEVKDDYLPKEIRSQIFEIVWKKYGNVRLILDGDNSLKTIELKDFEKQPIFSSLIIPKDKSWIIYTPRDLCRTIIAGSADFMEAVKKIDAELLSISPKTRIDYFADKINPTFRSHSN